MQVTINARYLLPHIVTTTQIFKDNIWTVAKTNSETTEFHKPENDCILCVNGGIRSVSKWADEYPKVHFPGTRELHELQLTPKTTLFTVSQLILDQQTLLEYILDASSAIGSGVFCAIREVSLSQNMYDRALNKFTKSHTEFLQQFHKECPIEPCLHQGECDSFIDPEWRARILVPHYHLTRDDTKNALKLIINNSGH